ncbi:hypothetical protein SDC9_182037 [bioreactor metagenome]|uniref:Uncharacterized protein n=1 Tax=bioreactor metagenome TaxID=1076179 RepID=A0A645HFU9_9ZZZZ
MVDASIPTQDISNPIATAIKPLAGLLPNIPPTITSPPMDTMNISAGPNFKATLANSGVKKIIATIPTNPPNEEARQEYDNASFARPFSDKGFPSNAVQAASPVPGQFIRIAETEPPYDDPM